MVAKRIIPCLDVTDGRVVKGTNFVDLKDAGDPIELAQRYDNEGADEVVFLDITASSHKRRTLIDLVKKTANVLFIPFTVGGGINSIELISDLLHAGADKVSINTAAIKDPTIISKAATKFGSQCIVAAIDAKEISPNTKHKKYDIKQVQCDSDSKWEIFTHGGRYPTGIDAIKWAHYLESLGAGEILLTSMDKDGTKTGYDMALTKTISEQCRIPIIASGGAGSCQHISDILTVADAALLASLLHFKELTIDEIKTHCIQKGIQIR
mgnify:CR=1 FL=1